MTMVNPPVSMIEYACPTRSTYVANLSLEQYKPIAAASRQRQCKTDLKGSHKRVVEWAIKHAKSNTEHGVQFQYRFACGKDFGRMTSNSMMGIPRDIRGFVCTSTDTGPILTDLDMDNCHPTILLWLCQKNGVACPALSEYVANRDRHKEDLMESTGKSKDDVKSMFLSAVNSQDEMVDWQRNLTPFYITLDKECKDIQQFFLQLAEYRQMLPFAETAANNKLEHKIAERRRNRKTTNGLTANVAGSFINLILCTWENRFLGVACKAVSDLGFEVSVNNFDGMMIRGNHYPEGDEPVVRDSIICPTLEDALFEAFGIRMRWSMKRHSTTLIYSDAGLKVPYPVHAKPFLDTICRVGSEYFVDMMDGTTITESERHLAVRLKSETAKCLLDHPGAESWYCRSSFAETLCRDPLMRSYEKADMYPDDSECPKAEDGTPLHYNLWKPMPCQSWNVTAANPESENVAMFRKLVLVLSDRDLRVASFLEHWITHMLKYPARKPNAWIVLLAEEGAGRGTLVRIIKMLVGESKVKEICNVKRSLLGTFNQAMLDAFFVVLDEPEGKHMFEAKEELKHLITEPTVPVNQKGIQEKQVRSYARFMLTSQPRAVPTKKGDRRGVIARCSDELVGNREHWKRTNEKLSRPDFITDVHAYLMTLQPPPVFQPDDLPQTEVQREMQAANADVFESWIYDVVERWLSSDNIEYKLSDYKGKRNRENLLPEFVVRDLYSDFRLFADRSNALRLIEGITYQKFVSRFAICRWRKAFEWKPNGDAYPKHKIKGVQQQCRRWDMAQLARDFNIYVGIRESVLASKKRKCTGHIDKFLVDSGEG